MGRTLPYLYFTVALVLVALNTGVARAQESDIDEKTVVVVIDSGNTDLLVESLVRSTAEAELEKRGFRIDENAEVGGDIPKRLLACAGNPECSVATLAGIGTRFVIFISLRPDEEGKSSNFKIVARNYEVATGIALARTMRRCAECREDVDLASFAEGVVVDLIREPAKEPTPPIAPPTPPQPIPEPVVAPPAPTPEPVLDPPLVVDHDDGGSALMTGLKYGTLVAGLTGLAAGTVLVLIDGPVVRDGVRQAQERDTLTGGYGSLAAGAVLVGVSAWLWSTESDGAPARTSLVPGLSSDGTGGSFVLTGAF